MFHFRSPLHSSALCRSSLSSASNLSSRDDPHFSSLMSSKCWCNDFLGGLNAKLWFSTWIEIKRGRRHELFEKIWRRLTRVKRIKGTMTEVKKDPFNEGGNLPECVWPYPGRRKRILGPNIGIKREAKAARSSSSNAKPKRNEDIRWR